MKSVVPVGSVFSRVINQNVLCSDRPIKGEADSVRMQRNPPGKPFAVEGSLTLSYCEISAALLPE